MKIKSIYYAIAALVLVFASATKAQNINNNLLGHYVQSADTTLYSFFTFDGNGKVDISGFGVEDFFVKGDTLFVFTDKLDVFQFKMEKDRITGLSSAYVGKGVWIKQDTLIASKRTDEQLALKRSNLLEEYYVKTRLNHKGPAMLFDEQLMAQYSATLEDLCNRGLAKACLENFGLRLMNESGGLQAVLGGKNELKVKESPELISLARKIIEMGEPEGHTVLAHYLYTIGKKKEADAEFEKAIALGSTKAALQRLSLELQDDENTGQE